MFGLARHSRGVRNMTVLQVRDGDKTSRSDLEPRQAGSLYLLELRGVADWCRVVVREILVRESYVGPARGCSLQPVARESLWTDQCTLLADDVDVFRPRVGGDEGCK